MSDVVTKRIQDGAVTAIKLSDGVRKGQYFFEPFTSQPLATAAGGYGTPAATGPAANELHFDSGLFAQYQTNVTEVILAPAFDFTTGLLDMSQDQTGANSIEWEIGGNHPLNPYAVTCDRTPSTASAQTKFVRLKVKIEDVSGASVGIGFRKQETFQADYNDYADLAMLFVTGGTINFVTIVGGAATSVVDTGAAAVVDTGTPELEVRVSGNGTVSFFVNGVQKYLAGGYQFTDALVVFPIAIQQHLTDLSKVYPRELEGGNFNDKVTYPNL